MKCQFCSEEIADNLKKCPVCNESLVNLCKFCKEEIAVGAIKCKHCGSMQNEDCTLNSKEELNTSGMGDKSVIPTELRGWSWGAFFFSWVWGIFNNSFLTLLSLIPFFGFIWVFVCGANGREWAWKNKRWENVEHFKRVQKKWTIAGLCLFPLSFLLIISIAIAIPAYDSYINESKAQVATNTASTCAVYASSLQAEGKVVSKQNILDLISLPVGYTMDIDNQFVYIYFDGDKSPISVAWN